MNKGIKIFACVAVFLGVISLIFLLTIKRKAVATPAQQTSQVIKKTVSVKKVSAPANQDTNQAKTQADKTLSSSQWQQCKNKTMAAGTTLFWNVQISEAIPAGGTYAKGTLDNDVAFPVQITIKSGIQDADKIKQLLIVGKIPLLRGTCTDVATDGSVVLQAF